jgi:hypothetical protein
MANLAARYVALIKETNYGATPGSPTYVYGEVDDESMSQELSHLDRTDITRYGKRKTTIGTKMSSGDITLAMQGDEFCGRLVGNVFGSNAHAGSAAPYTNTLTEITDEANYHSFTLAIGRDLREHRYLGQVLESLTIGANVNEYVMMSASFMGCGEDNSGTTGPGSNGFALAAPTNSDLHTGDAFHFSDVRVNFESKLSGTNYSELVKSVEVTFALNRDGDNAFALSSDTYTRAPPPTLREITGTIEFNQMLVSNTTDLRNAPFFDELSEGLLVDGSSSAPAMSLKFSGGTNESLEINIYKIQYEAPSTSVSGRDTQTLSVSFYALYDETEDAMADALWTTTDATNIMS